MFRPVSYYVSFLLTIGSEQLNLIDFLTQGSPVSLYAVLRVRVLCLFLVQMIWKPMILPSMNDSFGARHSCRRTTRLLVFGHAARCWCLTRLFCVAAQYLGFASCTPKHSYSSRIDDSVDDFGFWAGEDDDRLITK